MRSSRISVILLFITVVLLNVLLLGGIAEKVRQMNCFSCETAMEQFRAGAVSADTVNAFREAAFGDTDDFCALLTMYFSTQGTVTDPAQLKENIAYARKYRDGDFSRVQQYVSAVWEDLECFPVGSVAGKPEAAVEFVDSWMQSRTFGGDRVHEGTDLMATVNERGIYPIYSMTDGVVENIGWLKLGGYRIGIRSDSGAYFYYAHLAEYARTFAVGERVEAGEHLGFMGDTGYSEVEGTTGMFPVHLHLGIYLNDENGAEFAVNSYPILRYLWERDQAEALE